MKRVQRTENYLLIGHILSMAFGLAGIILVLPNPDFLSTVASMPLISCAVSAMAVAA